MSQTILKFYDLDLQGQIGLQTSKMFILTVNIEPLRILPSSLNFIEHPNVSGQFENW